MKNTNIKTTQYLLKIRDYLQSISQVSFSFTTLNKQFPIQTMDYEGSEELINAYMQLVNRVKFLSNQFEHECERSKY